MIDPSNLERDRRDREPLQLPAIQPLRTGRFPHHAYRPTCACLAEPKELRNYAGHIIGPPSCSGCGKPYQLDIELMPTFEPKVPGGRVQGR